jgi:hypothetical protein
MARKQVDFDLGALLDLRTQHGRQGMLGSKRQKKASHQGDPSIFEICDALLNACTRRFWMLGIAPLRAQSQPLPTTPAAKLNLNPERWLFNIAHPGGTLAG